MHAKKMIATLIQKNKAAGIAFAKRVLTAAGVMALLVGCVAIYVVIAMGPRPKQVSTIIKPWSDAVEDGRRQVYVDKFVLPHASLVFQKPSRPLLIPDIEYRSLSPSEALQLNGETRLQPLYKTERLMTHFLPRDFNFLKFETTFEDLTSNGDSFVSVDPRQLQFADRAQTSVSLGSQRLQAYFGLLHAHTSDSDGQLTPRDAFETGRDAAGLDFMAVTDHSDFWHLSARDEFANLKVVAADVSTPSFVALAGFEYSSFWLGHYVVLESETARTTYDDVTLDDFYDWLSTNERALIAFAHPGFHAHRTHQDFGRLRLDNRLVEKMFGMEVVHMNQYKPGMRGFSEKYSFFDEAFHNGWNVGPLASQDNHKPSWGIQDGNRIGVLLPNLSRETLLEALRVRRFYATMTPQLQLSVNLQTSDNRWAQMGESLLRNQFESDQALVVVRYAQPDSVHLPYRFEVVLNGKIEGVLYFHNERGQWTSRLRKAMFPLVLEPWMPTSVSEARAGEFKFWLPLPAQNRVGDMYFYIRLFEGDDGRLLTQSAPITIKNMGN